MKPFVRTVLLNIYLTDRSWLLLHISTKVYLRQSASTVCFLCSLVMLLSEILQSTAKILLLEIAIIVKFKNYF